MRFVKLISILIILSFIIIPVISVNAAIKYVDKDTNTTFSVPGNWSQLADKEDIDVDVMFSSDMNKAYKIYYSSSKVEDEDKFKINNEEPSLINNSLYSSKNMEEIYYASENNVTIVNYGKYYYFRVKAGNQYNFIRISNGWVYKVCFEGSESGNYYQDIEYILNNIKFPHYSESTEKPIIEEKNIEETASNIRETTKPLNGNYSNKIGDMLLRNNIIRLLFSVIFYVVPIIICRVSIFEKPVNKKTGIMISIGGIILGNLVVNLILNFFFQIRIGIFDSIIFVIINFIILTFGYEEYYNPYDLADNDVDLIESNQQSRGHKNKEGKDKIEQKKELPISKTNKNNVVNKAVKEKVFEKSKQTKKVNDRKRQKDIDEQSIRTEKEIGNINKKTEKREKVHEEETLFCRKCGRKLALDSEFCHKCGTKVLKDDEI